MLEKYEKVIGADPGFHIGGGETNIRLCQKLGEIGKRKIIDIDTFLGSATDNGDAPEKWSFYSGT